MHTNPKLQPMNVQNDIVSITFLLLLVGRWSKKAKNLEFNVVCDQPLIQNTSNLKESLI